MQYEDLKYYICPKTGGKLEIGEYFQSPEGIIESGKLFTPDGNNYEIKNGIPDLTFPSSLLSQDKESRESYDDVAEKYNQLQHVTFEILSQDEDDVRRNMVNLLNLKTNSYVLETAAGTGLNFPFINEAINGKGNVFAQDVSAGMIQVAKDNFEIDDSFKEVDFSFSIGNAAYLPFKKDFFDAAFSFGGIGVFNEKQRAIKEMCRVVKPGGRIVFGDEGVGPWLRNSEFGKILVDNNQFYLNEVPIDLLPHEAREVNVRWIMGGAFYLVDLTVGIGEPKANFDYSIPGSRGGTLNTRYYGKLEGVHPKTKELAQKAQKKSGKSMYEWLNDTIYKASLETLND